MSVLVTSSTDAIGTPDENKLEVGQWYWVKNPKGRNNDEEGKWLGCISRQAA